METQNQTALVKALSLAYRAVMALGFTHQQLVDGNIGVNYNTLRRIRDGKAGKPVSDQYFLQLFVSILNQEYNQCIANGGDGAVTVLRDMRKVTLSLLEIPLE